LFNFGLKTRYQATFGGEIAHFHIHFTASRTPYQQISATFSTNKVIFGGEIKDFSAVFTAIFAFRDLFSISR